MKQRKSRKTAREALKKVPTGIQGLDEITGGGLPIGRPTLVCGSAGCGKTLLGMEFLVRGARDYNEPGVFIAFEENAHELRKNVASLGFDLAHLIKNKKLLIDYVYIERSEIEETGEYDLEGLFIRLDYAIRSIGAKRVVLDTIEALFAGLPNPNILRAELRRLFRWLKDRGVTAVITAERGDAATLTRHGLEEYVADCVIMLDHRIVEQISTRRLRIVKYRGSIHGTNEYPFLIDEHGICVMPITSVGLDHPSSKERISSGITRLDTMLGGGFYRGSSILISGTAGTGKSSVAMHVANATCKRGESCLYLASEESANQIIRNGNSIGIDLRQWVKKGLLRFHSTRPTFYGLEMHLVSIHKLVNDIKPRVVIFDPISNLTSIGSSMEIQNMLTRLLDFLKAQSITSLCTSLTHGNSSIEKTEVGISSIMDTWLLLRDNEYGGERTRVLYILKSRGTAHSNQVREFLITNKGIDLLDVYVGSGTVYTGSARLVQEMKEKSDAYIRTEETERLRKELERNREMMEAKIIGIRAEFESRAAELKRAMLQQDARERIFAADRCVLSKIRKADN